MKSSIKIFLFSMVCLFVLRIYLSPEAIISGGAVAISDGKGKITLYWFPPKAVWPEGGFRIQDNNGKVWAKQILPLKGINKISTLSGKEKKWLRKLLKNSTILYNRNSKAKQSSLALIMKIAVSPGFSKALGLMHTIKNVPRGKLSFKIIGLNKKGRHTGMVLKCKSIDGYKASPILSGPKELRAKISPQGVNLFWKSKKGGKNSIVYFEIERRTKQSKYIKILNQPLFISKRKKNSFEIPYFTDKFAPQEQNVEYRVLGVDLFGRRSKPVSVKLFVSSFRNLLPPGKVKAEAFAKGIQIKWNSDNHSSLTTFIIERSHSIKGSFIAITLKGIKHSDKGYLDKKLIAGGTYYYRVKTIASDGSLSSPSKISRAIAFKHKLPSKINSLKVRFGINTVLLSWKAENRSVAGYIIERKVGKLWQRLNKNIWADNSFLYRYSANHKLDMNFRVSSVGINNKIGPPSKIVKVRINKVPKGKPEIVSIKQVIKGIEIKFDFPQDRQDIQFFVRRSGKELQEGMIISPFLSSKKKSFIDKKIVPGQTYWYRIQALGPQNWISKFSKAEYIKTTALKIPIPSKLSAIFKTKPFLHIRLTFPKAKNDLKIIVERRVKGKLYWQTLRGEGDNGVFIDANPPKAGNVEYRIRYKTVNGITGHFSDSVLVK